MYSIIQYVSQGACTVKPDNTKDFLDSPTPRNQTHECPSMRQNFEYVWICDKMSFVYNTVWPLCVYCTLNYSTQDAIKEGDCFLSAISTLFNLRIFMEGNHQSKNCRCHLSGRMEIAAITFTTRHRWDKHTTPSLRSCGQFLMFISLCQCDLYDWLAIYPPPTPTPYPGLLSAPPSPTSWTGWKAVQDAVKEKEYIAEVYSWCFPFSFELLANAEYVYQCPNASLACHQQG